MRWAFYYMGTAPLRARCDIIAKIVGGLDHPTDFDVLEVGGIRIKSKGAAGCTCETRSNEKDRKAD